MDRSDAGARLSRRRFLRGAVVGTAATATGANAALAQDEEDGEEQEDGEENGEGQEDGEEGEDGEDGEGGGGGNQEPDWPSFVEEANEFDTTEDMRGEEEVTVEVGAGPEGHAFAPPAIWIDQGATVIWEWTGEGGGHNVVTEEGPAELESEITEEEGFTYEHTFEESGITSYYCAPHRDLGMVGGVAAGEDIETREAGGGEAGGGEGGGVPLPDTARVLGVATAVAMGATLGFTYLFMKFGGEYTPDGEE